MLVVQARVWKSLFVRSISGPVWTILPSSSLETSETKWDLEQTKPTASETREAKKLLMFHIGDAL